MPQVTLLGIHPLDYSDEFFDEAVTRAHGLVALDTDKGNREYADWDVRQRLRSVVQVEMVIVDRDRSMYMGDFGQSADNEPGPGDPVADQEVFLSSDGNHLLGNYLDQIKENEIRVAFYLHDYRPDRPILTSYGPVDPIPLTPRPLRLKQLAPFRLPE